MVQPYLSPNTWPAHQLIQLSVRQNLPNVDLQHIHLEWEKEVKPEYNKKFNRIKCKT